MLTLLKWFLGFLVTLTVVIIAAIVMVPMVVDPNDYREEISTLVKKQTGRDLTLEGELSMSVFPWLGIRTEGLALSQPSEIGGDMLTVDTAQLRVKLAPLLSKQVHVDTVILEQPKVRLVTLKNGVDSFTGLVDSNEPDEPVEQTSKDNAGVAVALLIQGVALSDGQVTIDDRAAGTVTRVSNLSLETGNLIGDRLADLRASGRLIISDNSSDADADADAETVEFSMTSLANINVDTFLLSLEALQFQVQQAENTINLGVESLSFADQKKLNVKGLTVNTKGIADASLSAPNITANIDSQRADIPQLTLSTGEFNGRVNNLVARDFIDAPKASASVSIPQFNAAKLLKDLAIDYQTTDPEALKKVALNGNFSGNLNGAQITDLDLVLDNSQLKGSASINDFDNPAVQFDLVLDALNLDRYLPPSNESDVVADESSADGAAALVVPMAVFKEIQANGQFKAQSLISSGVTVSDIDVKVVSSQGKVSITPRASLYDGSLDGQIMFSETNGTSTLAVKNKVDLVQLGSLLSAAEVSDQLRGIGSVFIDLVINDTNGVQTNEGVIRLKANDGALKGVDVKGVIDSAYAKYQSLSGKQPQNNEEGKTKQSDETKFAELDGTFIVKNNVITNDDFSLKAPLFRVGGAGTIDIANEVLDYVVEVKLVASTAGQGGESIDQLAGIPIPIRFSGDLTAPNYSIDFKRMYKALFEREVEQKKGELLEEKLGIKGAATLSSKDILKGVLSNKLDKKLNKGAAQPQREIEKEGSETTLTSEDSEPPVEPQKSSKEQLKDELKNTLLDGLFGS